jgi:integration host factor subunit beta
MTRSDLIARLSSKFSNLTSADAEMSVKLILGEISTTLAKRGRAEIRGFGSFSINRRPERIGRNPKTGAPVEVPARDAPHFKPGKELRERVDLEKV